GELNTKALRHEGQLVLLHCLSGRRFGKSFVATHQINSEQQIYLKIAEFLRAGEKFALAVVMKDAGSTPRKAGTKAIIDEEGSIWGTIGGGLLESDARKEGVVAIRTMRPHIFDFKVSG